jgi:tyrosine-protein kinase Etk/Wzc
MVRLLSETHDLVLIDTPPVLPVADAAIVGRIAGCTLLVLKSAQHPMREIEETYRRLAQAGANVRGTIFNQVGRRVGSYGYGGYGYSYAYNNKYRYK